MSATLHTDPATHITTLTVTGRISASELRVALDEFYVDTPTQLALCDVSRADPELLSKEELSDLAEHVAGLARIRAGGRSAIVATSNLAYGLSRMYGLLAETNRHPVAIQVFRTKEAALQWLLEQPEVAPRKG